MSHFTSIKTRITDADALREALLIVGGRRSAQFHEDYITIHPEGAALKGFQGDDRSQLHPSSPDYAPLCEVVINRAIVGGAANDIGFARQEDGTLAAYISDYDARSYNADWLNHVQQQYGLVKAKRTPGFENWEMTEEVDETSGDIRLRMRQRQSVSSPVAMRL